MIVRLRRAAVAASLALVMASPAFGQSVLLRMNSEPGTITRYVTGLETYMQAPMMSSDAPMMAGEMYSTQEILSSEGDVFELRTTTDSSTLAMPSMQGMGANPDDLVGQSQTMKMDTRGRIVELTDLSELDPQARQVMSQMGGNGFGMELPEGEVSPGDTWVANLDMDMGAGMGAAMTMEMEITYTLLSLEGSIASITFEGPVTMSGGAQGMTMDGTGGLSGTMAFDVDAGRIETSDTNMSLDMNAAGMAMSLDQSINMHRIP